MALWGWVLPWNENSRRVLSNCDGWKRGCLPVFAVNKVSGCQISGYKRTADKHLRLGGSRVDGLGLGRSTVAFDGNSGRFRFRFHSTHVNVGRTKC